MKELLVFVPAAGSAAERMIDPASAIVGLPVGDRFDVHFEGNRYGAENLRTFHARLVSAAGRMTSGFPTVARASFLERELLPVARFDTVRAAVISVLDPAALERWAKEPTAAITGTVLEVGTHAGMPPIPEDEVRFLRNESGGRMAFTTRAGQVVMTGPGGMEVLPDAEGRPFFAR